MKQLPINIAKAFAMVATDMHTDLQTCRLEVVLVDAPEQKFIGHKIRVASNSNPWWYREYSAHYPHKLDRKCFINSLERFIKFKHKNCKYDRMLFQLIKDELIYDIEEADVINYFNTGVPF